MNPDIHVMIVTTLSMIVTFIFYHCLEGTRLNNSLFQDTFIDPIRDLLLVIRCLLDNGQINDTCKYYWDNIIYNKIFIFFLITLFCDPESKYQIEPTKKNTEFVVYTLIVVWFTARFFNVLYLSCLIDIFTVFFVFWQLIYLICEWHSFELPFFSFTLQQASLCIFSAFISYAHYDIVLRYLPIQYRFILLWFIAIEDCIACLYVHGRLYNNLVSTVPLEPSLTDGFPLSPYVYYVNDPRYEEIDDESFIVSIGLGDFMFYNLIVLFILSPSLSIINQIYVTIGAIVSVQIGYMVMNWTSVFRNKNNIQPAIPLPVIFYSAYAILIDIFTQNFNSDIC